MLDVLFINATKKCQLKEEVNGTLLLATMLLDAGFRVDVLRMGQIEGNDKDYPGFISRIVPRVLEMEPRVVSFHTLWPNYHVMLRIAMELKKIRPDLIIVMGGPQASATAAETLAAMDCIDYICTSEGEMTVVPFFNCILRENCAGIESIPGLHYRVNGKPAFNDIEVPLCSLDTLPYWDERLTTVDDVSPNMDDGSYFMNIDVGRGCPFNCSFCSASYFWRRLYRLKSKERIIEELEYYKNKYGIYTFSFSHDAFTTNRKLVSDVCDLIIEKDLNITWNCAARIDSLSEELIQKMKQSGMRQIELGVETGSPRMQKLLHKNLNLDTVRRMTKYLLDNGIMVGLFFMYGFPEETEEDLAQTLTLLFDMLDLGIAHATMSFLRFNPTTELTNKHFDNLVFDPSIKILSREVFGYEEEVDMIRDNKALFPFYYHLETPLRREFQYLTLLEGLYKIFPKTARYVRQLYKGDDMKFFRDFDRNNRDILDSSMDDASMFLVTKPEEAFGNTIRDLHHPREKQVLSLIQYERTWKKVKHSKEDMFLQDVYEFDLADVQKGLPIDEFKVCKSYILISKINDYIYTKCIILDQ